VWTSVFLLLALLHVLPFIAEPWSTVSKFPLAPLHLDPGWSIAIAGAWAILSLWKGSQLISSAIRLHGLAVRGTPVQADTTLERLLTGEKGGRGAELCTSVEVERPCVVGFFRPRILLPPALFKHLSSLELQQVILHEMEHLRRADDWTNLLQKIGLVLFPLNPALLWVERRLCAEREFACDDRVLHSTGARKAYAICLTRLAEYSMLRHNLSLVLGAWERQSELVRRVHRILRRPDESVSGRQAMVLTVCLIFAALASGVALTVSPQLVSFAPLTPPTEQARFIPASGLSEMKAQEFRSSPALIRVAMPLKPPQTSYASNHRRVASSKNSAQPSQPFPIQAALVVLTEWEFTEPPPRLMFAVAQDHGPSYAAVAMPNGWLIVQI
jgi:hypothetical protein